MFPPESGNFFDVSYGSGREPDLGGGWWISIPPRIVEKLSTKERIIVEVDNHRHRIPIHRTSTEFRIKIPISPDNDSESDRVIHKTADARFYLVDDGDCERLLMKTRRRYTNAEP